MNKPLLLLLIIVSHVAFGQGKFAGSLQSLVGKTYREEKDLTLLNGFTSRGGSLLSAADDPDKYTVSWFSRGNIIVATFEIVREDNNRQILDVLEIKNVGKDQELKIGDCKDADSENVSLIALVVTANTERLKALKAWYFNRDKIRIEAWPASQVTCLGAVGDD